MVLYGEQDIIKTPSLWSFEHWRASFVNAREKRRDCNRDLKRENIFELDAYGKYIWSTDCGWLAPCLSLGLFSAFSADAQTRSYGTSYTLSGLPSYLPSWRATGHASSSPASVFFVSLDFGTLLVISDPCPLLSIYTDCRWVANLCLLTFLSAFRSSYNNLWTYIIFLKLS